MVVYGAGHAICTKPAIAERRGDSHAEDVQPHDLKSEKPYVTYRNGDGVRIDCDFVKFHGEPQVDSP